MLLRRVLMSAFPLRRFFSSGNDDLISGAIAELNKEMESVFGEPPPSGLNKITTTDHLPNKSSETRIPSPKLTHVGGNSGAEMVDISPKNPTHRIAVASCRVMLGKKVFEMVSLNQMAKGDVLMVAKMAGINGAKQTSNLVPLCHGIDLTKVRVDLMLRPDDFSVGIVGEAGSIGRTGVEMEAMTAVAIAGLSVYDMCKGASKEIRITEIRLERKSGGRSGDWRRENN